MGRGRSEKSRGYGLGQAFWEYTGLGHSQLWTVSGALGSSKIHPWGIVGVETFLTSDLSIQHQSRPRYGQRWVSDVTVP